MILRERRRGVRRAEIGALDLIRSNTCGLKCFRQIIVAAAAAIDRNGTAGKIGKRFYRGLRLHQNARAVARIPLICE
jgi:hypothetical protein